jgi:hypothetical protein
MRERLAAAQEWMFGYGSPVTLGVLRILFGFLALVNLLMIATDFDAWFSERGYVPWTITERWLGDVPRLNLLAGVTDDRVTAAFYGMVVIAATLTTLGLGTRIAAIALAIGIISLHHRNPLILHGGDTMLRMCVIYLAVAPCGAALSLDRWILLRRGLAPATPLDVSLWPQRLFQIQIAIVYFTTVWHKWFGGTWRDGTAAWYPAQLTEFHRFPVPDFIYQPPFLQIATYGTLLVELALATLVFHRPFRKWVLLAGIGMHGYIEWTMNIPLFAFLMVASYVAHYDGDEVSRWLKRFIARTGEARTATTKAEAPSQEPVA